MKRKEKKRKNEDEETIVLVVKDKRETKENFKNTNKDSMSCYGIQTVEKHHSDPINNMGLICGT